MVEGHIQVRAVVGNGFQIINAYCIQKAFYAFGSLNFIIVNGSQSVQNHLGHGSKIFTRNPLIHLTALNTDFFGTDEIAARTVMLLALYQGNGQPRPFCSFGCTGSQSTLSQDGEKRIQFTPFSSCSCHHCLF